MAKKVIRLTESDLETLVKRVVAEQNLQIKSKPATLKTIKSNYPNANSRTFKVFEVTGKPVITKNGKDLLLTKGMTITPMDLLKFKQGDKVMMSSVSPEDKGRYFQQVSLDIDPSGKLELFVYSD